MKKTLSITVEFETDNDAMQRFPVTSTEEIAKSVAEQVNVALWDVLDDTQEPHVAVSLVDASGNTFGRIDAALDNMEA